MVDGGNGRTSTATADGGAPSPPLPVRLGLAVLTPVVLLGVPIALYNLDSDRDLFFFLLLGGVVLALLSWPFVLGWAMRATRRPIVVRNVLLALLAFLALLLAGFLTLPELGFGETVMFVLVEFVIFSVSAGAVIRGAVKGLAEGRGVEPSTEEVDSIRDALPSWLQSLVRSI